MEMWEAFYHQTTGTYIWGLILLLAIRAEYTCLKKKDITHAAAFIPVLVVATVMLLASLNMLPASIAPLFA